MEHCSCDCKSVPYFVRKIYDWFFAIITNWMLFLLILIKSLAILIPAKAWQYSFACRKIVKVSKSLRNKHNSRVGFKENMLWKLNKRIIRSGFTKTENTPSNLKKHHLKFMSNWDIIFNGLWKLLCSEKHFCIKYH